MQFNIILSKDPLKHIWSGRYGELLFLAFCLMKNFKSLHCQWQSISLMEILVLSTNRKCRKGNYFRNFLKTLLIEFEINVCFVFPYSEKFNKGRIVNTFYFKGNIKVGNILKILMLQTYSTGSTFSI